MTDLFERAFVRAMTQGLQPSECRCLVYPGKLTVLDREVHCSETRAIPVEPCPVHPDQKPHVGFVLVDAWTEEVS